MIANAGQVNTPLVNDDQVIDVQLDTEDQTDDEKTVCYDRRRRGRFQSKRVKNKFPDIIGQGLAFPQDSPGMIKEDVTHPSLVWNGEGEVLPVHGFGVTKDAVNDSESDFQVRVLPVIPGPHDWMSTRDGPEYGLVGFIANTLALDGEMEEGLGTEVGDVPQFRNNDGTSG